MKNTHRCPACGFDNNYYERICISCKNYLRDRVVNIDFWSILSSLVENPFKAFQTIIYAEHKNFILFLLLLAAIKYFIIARFIFGYVPDSYNSSANIFVSFLIILSLIVVFLLLYSFFLKLFWKYLGFNTRFKDNLALLIYSQIPIIFSLIFLFPLEIVIFGDYLFSNNPSPFQIKSTIAYIFFSVEVILILWSIFLSSTAFYVSTGNKILSIMTTLALTFILSVIIITSSKIIFAL